MSASDLSSFIEDVTGDSYLRVQENLGDGFVRLRAKEAQRRQAKQDITCFEDVVLELLRNSRDAHAKNIFIATWKEQGRRFITALDDGDGIPAHLHETVFEPFVTSKLDTFHEDRWGVHGRGMALYSIKENVDTAKIFYSNPGSGTALRVDALTSNLPEKIDQSSLPYIHVNDMREHIMRGPRNIARMTMEFALDAKDELNIYLGSPVEIAATLASLQEDPAKPSGHERISSYLHFVYDPEIFSELAAEIGLPLSPRSARRIINKEIKPLHPFIELLTFENQPGKQGSDATHSGSSNKRSLYKDRRKLKIDEADLDKFSTAIQTAFEELAGRYYLEQDEQPSVRATSDKITISIPYHLLR